MFQRLALRLAPLLWLVTAGSASADIAIGDPPPSPHNGFLGALLMGWEFVPTLSIELNALGWYDHEQDGFLNGPHEVGVFRVSDEALIVSATITSASVLAGSFRYEDVAPTILSGGASYVVAGVDPAGFLDRYPIVPDFAADLDAHPNLTIVQEAFLESGALVFPSEEDEGGAVGANFQFSVPEPRVALLFLTGLTAPLALRRSHRR